MRWHKVFPDDKVGYATDCGYLVVPAGSMFRITHNGRYVGQEPRFGDAKKEAERHARQQAERKYR